MRIAVIGSVFVDIKGYPNGEFVPTGRNAGHIIQVHGGVSRNVAENIGRAGFSAMMVGLTDTSGIGQDVIARLITSGVDTSYMRSVPNGCGTWLAVFDGNGDVAASVSVRPDLHEIADILLQEGEEIAAKSDAFVVELDMDSEILDLIFSLAESHKIPIYALVSNISIAMEQKSRLKQTACFVCNLQEASVFFGEKLEAMEPSELLSRLPLLVKKEQVPRMIVTMGEIGAVCAELSGESSFVQSLDIPVVDTTGAGDAFFSGVTIGLTSGLTLKQACEIGTAMAASVITVKDNTVLPEICREIQMFLS